MSVTVLHAISTYLDDRHADATGSGQLIEKLTATSGQTVGSPSPPLHREQLMVALNEIRGAEDRMLGDIGHAIQKSEHELDWRVDDGQWYPPGAGVGDGYRLGNMHTVLASDDDFAMGLFLLLPETDYLDHRHRAPEFYLNLTGGSRWRFDFGSWREMPAGSVLWNESNAVHATKTGHKAWLSVWAWMSDLHQLCEVVSSVDGR